MERTIPLYTLEGVKDAEKTSHSISTDDGLGLSLQRFERAPCDDVVVILHGLTTSTDMFIMPEHYNLVSYLLDNSLTDVWCFDFRMSNRHSYNLIPNSYNMDDVALYDHPKAIEHIRKTVGNDKRIHVIAHCLGSMSFAMALAAKTVTGISSFIPNSISLAPRIPTWSKIKLTLFPFFLERVLDLPYLSPSWPYEPRLGRGKIISKLVSLFHHECNLPSCHTLSMMWGSGWPALYMHENLYEVTHKRVQDLFGATGLNYHHHVLQMVKADHQAVKRDNANPRYDALPDNYFQAGLSIETPILFVTGDKNRVFSDSNIHCYQEMKTRGVEHHQLHVFENYGHQDIYMGKDVSSDVFPFMLDFINNNRQE